MDSAFALGSEHAAARDDADPLAGFADRFLGPDEGYYMDGNSLGLLPEAARSAVESLLAEWQELAIRGWEEGDPPWFYYGERLGERIAPLLGVQPETCVVTGGTTVNIHALVGSFLAETDAETVLVNELDFPTDHYAIRAQLRQQGQDSEADLLAVSSRDGRTITAADIVAAIRDHEPDIVFMPSVLYRSGQYLDMAAISTAAHEHDAVVGFDLAHSIGVIPHDLESLGVDFAVWCSYKYLHGGPGAVGGLYLHQRHHDLDPALAGWWGHEKATQFDMHETFTPAADAGAFQISTPPLLAMAPIDGALDVIEAAGIERIREKSLDLTGYLQFLIGERLSKFGYRVGTPREDHRRGGHVAVEHDAAAAISRALRDRGVVVDYRPPNVVRVCPDPLTTRFADVRAVVDMLESVVDQGAHTEYREESTEVT